VQALHRGLQQAAAGDRADVDGPEVMAAPSLGAPGHDHVAARDRAQRLGEVALAGVERDPRIGRGGHERGDLDRLGVEDDQARGRGGAFGAGGVVHRGEPGLWRADRTVLQEQRGADGERRGNEHQVDPAERDRDEQAHRHERDGPRQGHGAPPRHGRLGHGLLQRPGAVGAQVERGIAGERHCWLE
jgi:hypothetical protein